MNQIDEDAPKLRLERELGQAERQKVQAERNRLNAESQRLLAKQQALEAQKNQLPEKDEDFKRQRSECTNTIEDIHLVWTAQRALGL